MYVLNKETNHVAVDNDVRMVIIGLILTEVFLFVRRQYDAKNLYSRTFTSETAINGTATTTWRRGHT